LALANLPNWPKRDRFVGVDARLHLWSGLPLFIAAESPTIGLAEHSNDSIAIACPILPNDIHKLLQW
jgi:hypothetical protein